MTVVDERCKMVDVVGHVAVGHAGVGLLLVFQALPEEGIVTVQRTEEIEVFLLEWGQGFAGNVPFAEAFEVVEIVEETSSVDAVEVYLGKVGEKHFAERHELLEGVKTLFYAFQVTMDVEELKKKEFVRHYLQLAEMSHQIVHALYLWHEERLLGERQELLLQEQAGAPVVEHYADVL